MRAGRGAFAVAGLALLMLGACSDDDSLMNIRATGNGPDEFGIQPVKPLQMPENLAALPTPTLGASNRTDPTPTADAIIALGGNPSAGGGIPAGDATLVSQAGRFGVEGNVRQVLATEDYAFRQRNDGRLLERAFNVNVYYKAYRPMSLDQQAELARWRSVGVRNVSAPPPPVEE
ncbi:DUF3035 domain-containing protein [Cereibacter changlensis]|jgi:hypothetical protein|uniref:DUF3035 domain-containing protein n=2 Tax=Cereibacter changlensis TaxID=402884 RepID=A0A2T4K066_9RHOB|nr:DUF3035 domain-containing protein [Cereibacter changlensis]MBZ4690036.1 hypothetical protein [Cereibacter sp.]PTE23552.1 DUF3035 domain-containing protein [Cereibacter changlensis JA139]PZX58530.1 beta-barrel assembly complex subunit BamF [Cereibacter changlensis]TKA96931.1 DUF3035 domain-containing protein [Cereibacter changlensis]